MIIAQKTRTICGFFVRLNVTMSDIVTSGYYFRPLSVIPAELATWKVVTFFTWAGIQKSWTPASAGVTIQSDEYSNL